MQEKITFEELVRKLDDPGVSVDEISRYFQEAPQSDSPFSPQFEIDESRVQMSDTERGAVATEGLFFDVIVGILNRKHMRRRQREYERRVSNGWIGLRLVAEGNSWFQYPLKKNDDLIDFLSAPFAIYCLSAAGAELEGMLDEDNRTRIADIIRNTEAHGFLFSGGGNDIAGEEFINFIQNAAPSNDAPDYIGDLFDPFLDRVADTYRQFFTPLFDEFSDLKIFYHGYDHAIPVVGGKWLGPSLQEKNVPPAHWADIVGIMIDRYNAKLSGVASEFPGRLLHVSCVGAIGAEDQWRDELHSKTNGCRRAALRFQQAISEALPLAGLEMAAVEMSETEDIETAMSDAAQQASAAPDLQQASDEQLLEGDIIPDEDVGLDDAIEEEAVSLEMAVLESGTQIPAIYWPSNDANSPEYAHLDTPPRGQTFNLTPDDLELLMSANHFDPADHDGKVVFGLRGAALASGHEVENASSLDLVDVRPNHFTFRCVMGFYDRRQKRLWAYTGSTVPNANSMKQYYKWKNDLGPKRMANMLPTGCYALRRASHGWDKEVEKWKVPVALRLTRPGSTDNGRATVLRSHNDLAYGTADLWDLCEPMDNVHPAFSTTVFSSAGCLTIRGSTERYTNLASGQWNRFLGHILEMPQNGRIDLLLVTGAEGAIAARMRADGSSGDASAVRTALERLRVGSHGEKVRRLQEFLGTGVDGDFGPNTKFALTEKQKSADPQGKADGIYSPATDQLFGQDILTGGST